MKHYLLTFIATLLAVTAFAQSQEVPYSSFMNDWTVVDVNNDGKTWAESESDFTPTYTTGMKYTYHGSNPGNDWLISPAIHLESGKKYLISHVGKRYNSNPEKYTIYVGQYSEPEQLKSAHKIRDFDDSNLIASFTKYEDLVEVQETSDYYIGFHCTSPANKWYVYVTDFKITEYVEVPGAISNLTVTPGAQGAMKANLSWNWPSKNSLNGDLESQLTGAKIYRTDSSYGSATEGNLIATVTLTSPAAPGSSYTWTDETFPANATNKIYYYFVVPSTEGGDSPITPTKASCWIGPDELASVKDVTAQVSPDNINHIKINFVSAGKQGGYIDHSILTYKVTRRVGSGAETTVIDNLKYSDLPYTDTNVPGFNAYTYKVYVNQLSGDRGTDSNKVIGGGTVDLPYSNTFDNAASLDLFSFGHANTNTADWKWYSTSSRLQFQTTGSSSSQNDAWAIAPPMMLNQDGNYKLSLKAFNSSNTFPKRLQIYITPSTNVADWVTPVYDQVMEVTSASEPNVTYEFTAPTSGVYYIVFRHQGSDSGTHAIYVDDLLFERFDEAPLAVEDLAVTAGTNGAMQANLSWTNPTMSNKNNALTKIDKLVITRNGKEIHEITSGITVGGEGSYQDVLTDATAGTYSYNVVAYLDDVPGTKAEPVTIWLGEDTGVNAPTNLSIEIDPAHLMEGTVLLHFDAPTGKNGGYVNPANLAYNIYRKEGSVTSTTLFTSANKIAENYSGSIPYSDTPADFNKYTYGVRVVFNGTEVTDNTMFEPIMAGPTPRIPYNEHFGGGSLPATYTTFKNSGINTWSARSSDGSVYSSTGSGKSADAWLVTPGIYMEGNKTYVLGFDVWGDTSINPNKFGDLYFYVGQGVTNDAFDEEFGHIVITNKTREHKEARFFVEETGIYNIAIRNYASDFSISSVTVNLDDINIIELPVAPKEPTDATATVGTNGTRRVTLTWTNPTEANNDTQLSSLDKVEIYREGTEEAIATLTAQIPGEEGSYTDTGITAAGIYTYYIKPYLNGNTYDYATVVTDWVGPDQLAPVKDVVAKVASDNYNHIEISFVSEGANGGYINHDEVSYTITRRVGTSTSAEQTTVADNVKYDELPYVDTTAPGLNQYTYRVSVNELESDKGVDSKKVVGGGSVDLPYSNTFDAMPSVELFTMGHDSKGNRDWDWNGNALSFWSTVNTDREHDAWALTPPVSMNAQGNYKVTFKPLVSSSFARNLKVYILDNANPTEWGEPKYDGTVNAQTKDPVSIEFEAPATGIYYVAFRYAGTDASTYQYLRVDDLLIERFDLAPLAVENLKATAGAEGAMTATLTWTNPTMTNKDSELEKIDKIVILRDNEEVGTITTGIEVGGEGTYTDNVAEGTTGNYNYNVVAYLEDVPGAKSETATVWLGPDELKAPENVTATLSMDGYPQITFDAVTTGLHGGYIDAEAVLYKVYRGSTMIADNLTEPKYVDESEDLVSGTNYSYSVSSYIGETESAKSAAVSIKFMKVEDLPYLPDFSNDATVNSWTLTNFKKWTSGQPYQPALCAYTNTGSAITPPFKAMKGEITLELSLSAEGTSSPQDVSIYLLKDPSETTTTPVHKIVGIKNVLKNGDPKPEAVAYVIEIPEDGVYYLKYNKDTNSNWYFYIHQSDITQSSIADPNNLPEPHNVAFEIQEDGSRLVSFDAVTENMGGEPVEVTYTIYRDGEQIAEGVETNSYVDNAEVELGKHYYGVRAVNGEYASKIVNTESQLFGGAITLPYKPDFSTAESFEYWTMTNGGSEFSSGLWKYNSSNKRLGTSYVTNHPWAITPPLKMEKGKVKISYTAYAYSGQHPSDIEIYLIDSPTHAAENKTLLHSQNIPNSYANSFDFEFEVDKTGVYYIGLVEATEDQYALEIDKLEIIQTEVKAAQAPEAVSELTAVAGAQGAMKVTLSWTNPTLTVDEEELDAISAIIISEGEDVIATLEDSEYIGKGEEVEYTVTGITTPGIHTYSVTVRVEDLSSEAAEATTTWVGIDSPKPVENATATLSADRKTVTVSWDAVAETGEHGGYVDTDAITYDVIRMPGNVSVATESSETNVEDDVEELGYGKYYYQVSINGHDDVEAASTDKVIVGDALELPYTPDYTTAEEFDIWNLTDWAYGSIPNHDNSLYSKEVNGVAVTPPFKAQTGRLKLSYIAVSYSATNNGKMEVYLSKNEDVESGKLIATEDLTYSSMPKAKEMTIEIEEDGIYYLGFKDVSSSILGIYLTKTDIEQSSVYAPAAPKAPASVTAAIEEDGSVTVTFEAVTLDINDYEIEGVTYEVYRNGEKLGETETTAYTDEETEGLEFAKYVYSVKAVWNEMAGEATEAEALFFGEALDMNYSTVFEDDNELWTVMTPDGSEGTWIYVDDEEDPYFYTTSADAVLVTPPLYLEYVKAELNLSAAGGHETETEKLNLHVISGDDLTDSKIDEFELNGTAAKAIKHEFEIQNEGVGRIGFTAQPAEGSTGVRLYLFSLYNTGVTTGVKTFSTDTLVYDRSIATILIPAEGILEVFSTNGMRVVRVETNSDVNISGLGEGTYVARFVSRDGNVSQIKFVK